MNDSLKKHVDAYKSFVLKDESLVDDRVVDLILEGFVDEREYAHNDVELKFLEKVYSRVNVYRYLLQKTKDDLFNMIMINEKILFHCKIQNEEIQKLKFMNREYNEQ